MIAPEPPVRRALFQEEEAKKSGSSKGAVSATSDLSVRLLQVLSEEPDVQDTPFIKQNYFKDFLESARVKSTLMTYGAELQLTSQSEEDILVDDSQAERDEVDFIQEQRNSSKGTNSQKKSSNSKESAESKNEQLEQIIENNLEDVL